MISIKSEAIKGEKTGMDIYAKQALEECCSDTITTRRGGKGKPFWNVNATQFMYAPSFQFTNYHAGKEYVFTAIDCNQKEHTFVANSATAPLTPIWKELPTGVVTLKVEVVFYNYNKRYPCGARTFYKMSPFPGRDALPPKALPYDECVLKGLRYTFNDPTTRHWLTHGLPKGDYIFNIYSSKTISAIVRGMIAYANLEPENANEAMQLAVNAADYLVSISYDGESPVAGIPPTYSFLNIDEEVTQNVLPNVKNRINSVMMIYPAEVGSMYLQLEEQTQDPKYFQMAEKIANYYYENVLPNGSWPLIVSGITGEPETSNCCCTFDILDFLNNFYKRTGEERWNLLAQNYYAYIEQALLTNYNWEAQFEDSSLSDQYSNLSHYSATALIRYILKNFREDKERLEIAEELMRFVEDQFVVWDKFSALHPFYLEEEHCWFSPAGLEQYHWYLPIDASTADIAKTFLHLYSATKKRLYLEKSLALADSITRRQSRKTGAIPTHWIEKNCEETLSNFWMNCHLNAVAFLNELANFNFE